MRYAIAVAAVMATGSPVLGADGLRTGHGHESLGGIDVSGSISALAGAIVPGGDDLSALVPIEDGNGASLKLRGTVNARAGAFNVQLGAGAGHSDLSGFEAQTYRGAIHAYYRPEGGRFALGAYGEATMLRGGVENLDPLVDATAVTAGAEAALLREHVTLYARAGVGPGSYEDDAFETDQLRYHLAAGARIFIGDAIRLDLEGAFDRTRLDGIVDGHADMRTLSAVANYRPADRPLSLFAGYRHQTIESVAGITPEPSTNTLFAGARLHFGTATLREAERTGALWSDPGLLP